MTALDVILWQDRQTPALATDATGGICYLDNLHPNYGKPMYVCKSGRSNASFATFESACAWFDWIKVRA